MTSGTAAVMELEDSQAWHEGGGKGVGLKAS